MENTYFQFISIIIIIIIIIIITTLPNLSSHTVALWLAQPPTEKNIMNLPAEQ
jgi:hypothetical protein